MGRRQSFNTHELANVDVAQKLRPEFDWVAVDAETSGKLDTFVDKLVAEHITAFFKYELVVSLNIDPKGNLIVELTDSGLGDGFQAFGPRLVDMMRDAVNSMHGTKTVAALRDIALWAERYAVELETKIKEEGEQS